MRVEIAKLHAEPGATMIYVTHDQTEAMTLADTIVVLRECRIAQSGAPLDLHDDPDNRFVAGFTGSPRMNFLPATVAGREGDRIVVAIEGAGDARLALPVSAPLEPGRRVALGIRPEPFAEGGRGGLDLALEVEVAEHLGGTSHAYARAGGQRAGGQVVVQRPAARHEARAGGRLLVAIPPGRALLLDEDGRRLR